MVVGASVSVTVGTVLLAASTPATVMLLQPVFRNIGRSVTMLLGG